MLIGPIFYRRPKQIELDGPGLVNKIKWEIAPQMPLGKRLATDVVAGFAQPAGKLVDGYPHPVSIGRMKIPTLELQG
jgi:hypothetical protein